MPKPEKVHLVQGALYRVWRGHGPVTGVLDGWDAEYEIAWLLLPDGSQITPRLDQLEAVNA